LQLVISTSLITAKVVNYCNNYVAVCDYSTNNVTGAEQNEAQNSSLKKKVYETV